MGAPALRLSRGRGLSGLLVRQSARRKTRAVLFNSVQFLIFFPLAVAGYFALPQRLRWCWLLLLSYYFYMCWRPEYVVLIVGSTAVDYWAGLQMGKRRSRRSRRPFLIASLAVNLGVLFAFKYANFFSESFEALLRQFDVLVDFPGVNLLLPVGISFYTFQSLGYSIDVYRGEVRPERHFGYFALYVTYFPQLVAGPIERYSHLAPQFRVTQRIEFDRIASGLALMAWGLFKKVVIADRLAAFVDTAYADPSGSSGLGLLVASYAFAVQIYCDFSGYSDMAIGGARVLGHDLRPNFRTPYLATSISDFWRRWHISLSTWFRDYVYIPLGGGRGTVRTIILAVMMTFLVSGLWHGANWTFVLWGAFHGLCLLGARARRGLFGRLSKKRASHPVVRGLSTLATFHIVLVGWILFRSASVSEAWTIFAKIFSLAPGIAPDFVGSSAVLVLLTGALCLLLVSEFLANRERIHRRFGELPLWFRSVGWLAFLLATIVVGAFDSQDFIYFQF